MPELSALTSTRRPYKDISLTFAKNPVTGDVVTLTDEDAVKRSLRLILGTRMGEAPFFPDFGSRITSLLFEPISPLTEALLRSEILNTIDAYESRVRVRRLTITPTSDELGYNITLEFNMVTQLQPVKFTFYLSRLR